MTETNRNAETQRTSATAPRVADKAHETIDRAAEYATDAEQAVRSKASRAAEKLREKEEAAAATMDQSMETVRGYIEKNPIASAGIAFAFGIIVSTLLRR